MRLSYDIKRRWNSWNEFIDYCNGNSQMRDNDRASRETNYGRGFHTTRNYEEAINLALDGWTEILPEVRKLSDSIKEELGAVLIDTFNMQLGVVGSTVDIGNFIAGVPTCMVDMVLGEEATVNPVVRILVNNCFSARVTAQDIQLRGAAICTLVECLELTGHSTEIWAESHIVGKYGSEDKNLDYLVLIKASDETLDMGRVCFGIGHGDLFRRFIFSAMEREDADIRESQGIRSGGGYGYPAKCIRGTEVNANITLDLMQLGTDPIKWVRQHLVTFGVIKGY